MRKQSEEGTRYWLDSFPFFFIFISPIFKVNIFRPEIAEKSIIILKLLIYLNFLTTKNGMKELSVVFYLIVVYYLAIYRFIFNSHVIKEKFDSLTKKKKEGKYNS